jgi:hypothetical protein
MKKLITLFLLLSPMLGISGQAKAAQPMWQPDPYLFCSQTASGSNDLYRISYAGIAYSAGPGSTTLSGSDRTVCRDLFVSDGELGVFPAFAYYSYRRIDWAAACRVTYESTARAYFSSPTNSWYCRR